MTITMDIPTKHSTSPISPPANMNSPPNSTSGSPPSMTVSPQERAMSTSPPSEGAVRHVQSNTALHPTVSRHPNRLSAHLGNKSTTKSPATSIPSSPTSVHSSSSAIFERDIELINLSSPSSLLSSPTSHSHSTTQHVTYGRAHALDASVPAVLDTATEILASLSPEEVAHGDVADTISIVAPVSMSVAPSLSGFSSPSAGKPRSLPSRSPSPVANQGTIRASSGSGGNLMLNLSPPNSATSPPPSPPGASANVTARPTINTAVMAETPSIVTPTSVYYSTAGSSPTVEGDPHTAATTISPASAPVAEATGSPPRSPKMAVPPPLVPPATAPSTNKRLSFLSYNDILASTPASTVPLSSLTTSARSDLPPAHLPEVDAGLLNAATSHHGGSGTATSSPRLGAAACLVPVGPDERSSLLMWRKDVSIQNNPIGQPGGSAGPMDEGGEWEREGLGMGLEERLEAIEMMNPSSPPPTAS